MGEKASIYGTSVEGYSVALSLLRSGDEVSVLDERIKTSYTLADKAPQSIRQLVGEDSLYPIQPLTSVLQEADKVVLAPRLRYSEEGRAEWLQRLKEVGQNLKEGATLLNLVPLSIGGNREALAILQEQSGLKAPQDFSYVYSPASQAKIGGYVAKSTAPGWIAKVTGGIELAPLDEAELQYVRWSLASYMPKALDASFYRDPSSAIRLPGQLFLDDMAQGLYEMQLFSDTLQHGDTLHHYSTGALKAVSGYSHTLGAYLRNHARDRGLKAIRSRILLVWTHDNFEMKGERTRLLGQLLNSLREVFGDVDFWNPGEQQDEKKRPPPIDKYQMIVPCSKADLELCRASMRRTSTQALITASVPVMLL